MTFSVLCCPSYLWSIFSSEEEVTVTDFKQIFSATKATADLTAPTRSSHAVKEASHTTSDTPAPPTTLELTPQSQILADSQPATKSVITDMGTDEKAAVKQVSFFILVF